MNIGSVSDQPHGQLKFYRDNLHLRPQQTIKRLHCNFSLRRLTHYLRCIAHNSFGIYVRTYRLNIKLDEKPLEAIDQLVPGGVPSISQPGINSNPQNSDALATPEVYITLYRIRFEVEYYSRIRMNRYPQYHRLNHRDR